MHASYMAFNIIQKYISIDTIIQKNTTVKCWLCGQVAVDYLPLRDGLSKTFCLADSASNPNSDIICIACHAMASKPYFDQYVNRRPEMGLKIGYASSWRNYSHVFYKNNHFCPNRSGWEKWLLDPPDPPFLYVVALSSQKHLIYKSKLSFSRDSFFVQVEDDSVLVDRKLFQECLLIIQKLIHLGFYKKQILTNRYNGASILKNGKKQWKILNDQLVAFRRLNAKLIDLACFITPPKEKAK